MLSCCCRSTRLLTLVSLTIVPALFVLIAVFNRKITAIAAEVRERESHVYTLVQWAMSSVKVVQAFTKEEEEYRRFMGASRASLGATLRLYSWQTLYSGAVNALIAAGHGARRLCRRALGAERHAVARRARRLHLVPGAALRAGEPDHPELGPDRRRAHRRHALLRDPRHRARSQGRHARVSRRRARAATSNGAASASATGPRCRCCDEIDLQVAPGQKVAIVGADRRRQIDAAGPAAALLRSERAARC